MRRIACLLLCCGFSVPALAQPQQEPPKPAVLDDGPLPAGAKLRLGSTLFRTDGNNRFSTLTPDGKQIVQFAQPDQLRYLSVETGRVIRTVKLKEQIQAGYGMTFSPTGERLVLTAYNTATVVNPATGEVTGKLVPRNNNNQPFARRLESLSDGQVSISGDGKRIAFGTRYPQQEGQTFGHVYDFDKNDFIAEVKVLQTQYIQSVLSSDGKRLATFGQYYVRNNEENVAPIVQIWDVETKKELAKFKTGSAQVAAARFSPDGKTVYTGGQGGPVEAWDVATGRRLHQFITRSNVGQRIFVSDDGKRLAASANDGSGAVQVWEADTGKRLGVGFATTNSVDTVALPKDGPAVAFGLYYNTLQIWTVPGKLLTPQDGHFGPVGHIHYTPDSKEILTGGQDGRIVRWDAATGEELESFGYANPSVASRVTPRAMPAMARRALGGRSVRWTNSWSVYNGTLAPDAQTIYVPSGNGGVAVVDLASGQEQYTLFFPNSRNGSSSTKPSLSRDGKRVGAAGQYYDRNKYIFTAAAWDTETGKVLAELRKELDNNISYINGMSTAVSADGNYFGVLCNIQDQRNGQSFLEFTTFDLRDGRQLATGGTANRTYSPYLLPSPDNRSAVSLDQQQNKLLVWDLPTGKQTRAFTGFANGIAFAPTFHPTGRTFAVPAYSILDQQAGTTRQVVRIVEWASGETRMELGTNSLAITALSYSPDGRTLAVGWQDSTVLVFDATGDDAPKPWKDKPTAPEKLWDALSGKSAREAWAAMRELTERPDVALATVREHVKPVAAPPLPTADEVAKLIGSLDAPAFAARETAMKDLKRYGKMVETELRKAMDTTPSPETKERIEKLLTAIAKPMTPNPTEARAVELLERIGNAEAKAELAKLAAGDPASLMTQDAAASLKRLGGK
ncbi:MAG: PQQ-binding-like beta-propeller repeat protein [Gemmataceae bacterium]|nr:PQQ-binding-like beta-propeller repeat protein [Gemmataceae bacterium]